MKISGKGFTPVIDKIKNDVGRTPALVYGAMYRFSKQSDLRLCTASQEKIAKVAGVGRDTVINAQSVLSKKGYIHKAGLTRGGTIIWSCNVTITGQLELSVDLSEKSTGGVEKSDSPTIKKVVKKQNKKGDLVDAVLKYGGTPEEQIMDVRWLPPDVAELLMPFVVKFKARFKREPTKSERGYWIAEAREWLQRGYQPKQVYQAWDYATNQGTVIKSPRSITYAFDQLSAKDDEFFAEEM